MPAERRITVRAAILEALFEEMRRDPNVFLMGEDIGAAGGVLKQTEGLFGEFGPERVIDTPISESGAFGIAVGAAMTGMRPIFEVMFGDFMTLVLDQLVNQAAKVHYMSAGGYRVPLVLRTMIGAGGALGPQHSQSLHAWTAHIPGLKVVAPSDAADAKGLFKAAVRDDNPVVFLEDRRIHGLRGAVPDGDVVVPLGQAAVKRIGADVTIIAIGRTVAGALAAADVLAAEGVSVEIIDPRTLAPLDTETLLASVRKTSRALVVDIGHRSYGVTGEIAATIGEQAFDYLDAPVARLAAPDIPIPFHPRLEGHATPDADDIADAVRGLVG
ncbi:MAG: alpha-ketoacid dehydrogenase subunit beta [Alphaproteobacteria bacterium]